MNLELQWWAFSIMSLVGGLGLGIYLIRPDGVNVTRNLVRIIIGGTIAVIGITVSVLIAIWESG